MAKNKQNTFIIIILIILVIGVLYFSFGGSLSVIQSGSNCEMVKFHDENGMTYTNLQDISSHIQAVTGKTISASDLSNYMEVRTDGVYQKMCTSVHG